MVIVSPYARAGYTNSTPATFASILAFVEQTFGLPRWVSTTPAHTPSPTPSTTPSLRSRASPWSQQPVPLSEQQYIAAHPSDPDDPT